MFEKDQKVWCAIYGAGVIVEIQHASEGVYPVVAVFKSNGNEIVVSYTSDGKYYVGGNITLFPYPIEIVKAAKREQLLRALERNQEQALATMTVDQLQEELKKLG